REIGVLSVLARIRMREIEGDKVSAVLDETGRRVTELLGQRESALAAVAAELTAAEQKQAALAQDRVAQQGIVAAAEKAVDEAEAGAAGVPARKKALAEAQAALAGIDEKIHEQDSAVAALVEQRAAFAAGDDDISRKCNELIRETLKREQMRTLRERAT